VYQNFIIPYLYEAQHVSGDTPPIIRSLNLYWQPLVILAGFQAMPEKVHQPHVHQPSTYEKPEAATADLGS
jgi:hypothetical protein